MKMRFALFLILGLAFGAGFSYRLEGPPSLDELRDQISARSQEYAAKKKAETGNDVQNREEHPTEIYCYGVLGCLTIDDSWYDPINRCCNPPPMPREDINTRFILHTREKPTQDTLLYADDPDTIKYSAFNPKRPTKFLVHGFVDDGTVKWMKRLTANLLDHGDYNVIIVNWGQGSLPIGYPLYTQATANTRLVGLEIGHMVNTMIEQFGVDPADVHLIGHSLGAHTVGYAGEQIEGLGWITGLDPAEPYFQYLDPKIRLDPTDAKFVEAIHTDAKTILLLGYGMLQPVGHLDFYVNGGYQQPGCNPVDIALDAITEDMITAGRELAACNHLRSIEFYIDSLVPGMEYVGYECPYADPNDPPTGYDAFKRGECFSCGADNKKCARFGVDSFLYPTRDRTLVNLFFKTGKDAPYILSHYGIQVQLANPRDAEKFVWGNIDISLYGTKSQLVSERITEESVKMMHGENQLFLYVTAEDVGKIQRIELHWNYDQSILDPGSICGLFCNSALYVSSVTVTEMNHYPESSRLEYTAKGCPLDADYVEIKDLRKAEFYPTACA